MFVFGEVQDPNPETVNLVEDIVRSQLTELVSSSVHLGDIRDYSTIGRSCRRVPLQHVAGRGTFLQKTSSFL